MAVYQVIINKKIPEKDKVRVFTELMAYLAEKTGCNVNSSFLITPRPLDQTQISHYCSLAHRKLGCPIEMSLV